MDLYLTPDEIVALTGYQTRPAATRWLERNGWPYAAPARNGWPRVLRAYHDARLSGLEVKSRAKKHQEPAWTVT